MMNENNRLPNNGQQISIKQLLPILIPLGSVLASVLGVTVAFTKVQMESNVNGAQLAGLESRLDRFQQSFDVMRSEAVRDNRDRDRLIERSAATNEAQNARIDSVITALRRMDDFYRMPNKTPNSYPSQIVPESLKEALNALHQ